MGRTSLALGLSTALAAGALAYGCGTTEDGVASSAGDAGVEANVDVTSPEAGGPSDAASEASTADATADAGPCTTPDVPALALAPVTTDTFANGVFAAQPPGSDDWYVVEQGGRVKIVRAGAVLPTPFLDISAAIGVNLGERGLLSIAFHPDYANNGRFFVMATPADQASGTYALTDQDAVAEFKRSSANPDVADPTKVRDIVVLPASAPNHNGGTIAFGPDGKLYVGTGDGGGGCESAEPGAVQDTKTLFGKILRLDVDAAAPFAAAGNPFADDARVYHYGLRNPFRWGFDSLTGDLYIGDVGQSSYEEISVAVGNAPAKNFGWPAFEGMTAGTCPGKTLGGPSPHTPPIVAIDRTGKTPSPFADYSSVIGGRVYRGSTIAPLAGVYVFGDFTGAEMGFLRYCNGELHGPVAVPKSKIAASGGVGGIAAILEGHDHELYVLHGYGAATLAKLVAK